MKTDFFISDGGTRLAYVARNPKNARVGVIILHGLAEHKGRYEEFMDRLAAAGISAFAVDLRGQGESSGRRGDVENFDDYLSDLDSFVRFVRKKHPGLKLAIFGHSLGGLIAATYVADYAEAGSARPNEGAGTAPLQSVGMLILSSPSLETPRWLKVLRRALAMVPAALLGKIYTKKRHSESPAMMAISRSDPNAVRRFTLRLLKVAFIDGIGRAARNFRNIRIPVLMLGGRLDNITDSGGLRPVLEKFGGTDKTLTIYENARHRIVQNAAKDQAIPEIIDWLRERA